LRPGILAFFDYSFFDGLKGYGSNGSGAIASAGFGFFAEVLFAGNIAFYAGFPLVGERIDESRVSIFAAYGMHF
jgi:hypothetical protein